MSPSVDQQLPRKPSAQTKSKDPPKRRNTMNSRDPDLEHVLDLSRKEAERAGLIPEADTRSAAGADASVAGDEDMNGDIGVGKGQGRKRKRAGELDTDTGCVVASTTKSLSASSAY